MKKSYQILFLLLLLFCLLSWPDPAGRSLYAYGELVRDLDVLRVLSHGQIILLGPPSSLGAFYFGPAYYYLLFPIVWVARFAPWSMPVASILYGCLTILLAYYIVRRWWGSEWLAILASGLMAASSLSFQFAKYESNPNQVPLFALLFFFALERLIGGDRKIGYAFLLGASFGIGIQLHAVPLICLPIILLLAVLQKRLRLPWYGWVVVIMGAVLVISPYLYYECTHHFTNIRTLFAISSGPRIYVPWFQQVLDYLGFWISAFLSTNTFFNPALILGWPVYAILGALLSGGFGMYVYDKRHLQPHNFELNAKSSVRTALGYWFWVPTIVLLLPIGALTGLRIYYYFILSPLVFMMLALGLAQLWQRGLIRVVYYTLAAFLLLQIGQAVLYDRIVSGLH